ncbi:MAG: YkgJ family cysteine cluster protein, partial [Planctomycetes bacterium]|nr:YkgJ family cysteine cluster protein [Planctomycetota bacterium]
MSMAAAAAIPLKVLPLGEQRYSCHGCGDCCRDFTVQLRERDLARLREQGWERELGDVTVEFRGRRYLRQRADGACVFLLSDGRCRIHAEHGFEAKPVACQLFPFTLAPDARAVRVGVSFACASVLASKGASLASHLAEVRRMAGEVDELAAARTMLDARTEATPEEADAVADAVERWMADGGVPLPVRIDGLAWLAQQLARARFDKVRGARLRELLSTLVGAIPDELPLCPVEPPTRQQLAALRQAAFFRLEDPKIGDLARLGRVRATVGQYLRSRAFSRGRGAMPAMGDRWPSAPFAAIEAAETITSSPDRTACEELIARWVRATVLGGRTWGSGFYGWSVVDGLQALALNVACAGWLARAHAAAAGRAAPTADDLRAAIGRVDRTSGRAPWIGGRAERIRLRWLCIDDGLRRVVRAQFAPGAAW